MTFWLGCVFFLQTVFLGNAWAAGSSCSELVESYQRTNDTGRFQAVMTVAEAKPDERLWSEIHFYDQRVYDRKRGSVWVEHGRGIWQDNHYGTPLLRNCIKLSDDYFDGIRMTVFQAEWQWLGDRANLKVWISQESGKLSRSDATITGLYEYSYFYSLLGKTVIKEYTYDHELPAPTIEPPLPEE
jgi:hypothetical protein